MTRLTLQQALEQAEQAGLFVTWVPMPHHQRGAYHHATRTIFLAAAMPDEIALPTLLHEMIHASRGDDGHQSPAVEARINRQVALALITWEEYAAAEAVTGGRGSGAIAAELDLPRWVVAAYRQTLRDGRHNGRQ